MPRPDLDWNKLKSQIETVVNGAVEATSKFGKSAVDHAEKFKLQRELSNLFSELGEQVVDVLNAGQTVNMDVSVQRIYKKIKAIETELSALEQKMAHAPAEPAA